MEALTQKLDTLSFAVAGAIYGAALVSLATIAALLGIPGLRPFTDLLTQFYGSMDTPFPPLAFPWGRFGASSKASCILA